MESPLDIYKALAVRKTTNLRPTSSYPISWKPLLQLPQAWYKVLVTMLRINLSRLCSQCPLELASVPADPPPASIPSYAQAMLLSQFLQLRALSTWENRSLHLDFFFRVRPEGLLILWVTPAVFSAFIWHGF